MVRKNIISENQLALPFNDLSGERHRRVARAITFEDRQRFFWFLVSVSLFSLVLYFYAVNATAHHIAVRQNLESEVAEVNSRLSSLEFSSIALRNAITLEIAHEYGFSEVKEPLYVSRSTPASLTLNTVTR
jgi:hypothetical protein